MTKEERIKLLASMAATIYAGQCGFDGQPKLDTQSAAVYALEILIEVEAFEHD